MAVQKFEIIRGTSKQFIGRVVDDIGAAVDLTDAATMLLKVAPAMPTATASLTLNKSLSLYSTAIAGIVTYTFLPTDTSSLSCGDYYGEVHIIMTIGTPPQYRTKQPFLFRIVERVES